MLFVVVTLKLLKRYCVRAHEQRGSPQMECHLLNMLKTSADLTLQYCYVTQKETTVQPELSFL